LAIAISIGVGIVALPWLASLTEVDALATPTAMLLLPGMIPGMIVGATSGGGIHDISFPTVLISSGMFYAVIAYAFLRWRSKRMG